MTDHDSTVTLSKRDYLALQNNINQLQRKVTIMKTIAIALALTAALVAYHDVKADDYDQLLQERNAQMYLQQQQRQTEALEQIQRTQQQQYLEESGRQSLEDYYNRNPIMRPYGEQQ